MIQRFLLFIIMLSAMPSFAQEEPWDPIEPVNRNIFAFNDFIDVYLLEPVARTYDKNVPELVQTGIGNFYENLRYPQYLVSDLVQLKFGQVVQHTGRFAVNSTVGILGFMDPAKNMGLPRHEEDFGIALAYHGIPAGPYLVIPIIGPSNVRDGIGRVVDIFLDPMNWIAYSDASSSVQTWVPIGSRIVKTIDQRARLLGAVEAAKETSLDYYLFTQSSFYQYRHGVLTDGAEGQENEL
jgi:phospholipid-binding lipoprotein MlaA